MPTEPDLNTPEGRCWYRITNLERGVHEHERGPALIRAALTEARDLGRAEVRKALRKIVEEQVPHWKNHIIVGVPVVDGSCTRCALDVALDDREKALAAARDQPVGGLSIPGTSSAAGGSWGLSGGVSEQVPQHSCDDPLCPRTRSENARESAPAEKEKA